MKKILSLVAIPVLFQLTACFFLKKNGPEGIWFYTFSSNTPAKDDTTLTPASFLNLQENGTYTSEFAAFDYGVWKINDHKIYLTNQKGEIIAITVEYLATNEMRLSFDNHVAANFERQPGQFKTMAKDPFSKENNFWRMAAGKKETGQEIKNRLLNHFKFWETYFTWALDDKLETIDVRSTPTLVKIYGNGFALKPYSELPAKWKSYFYDEEDCQKANDMVKEMFDKNEIAMPRTENKYKMFISAFQQLQQKIK